MIGTHIGGYEVLSELGSGGMGTVYLGRAGEAAGSVAPNARVALKVIHPNLLSQPGFFKRFLREAEIGQRVEHENVVRTYDCDATETDGRTAHFLVMEYVEGQTLRDLLEELERVPEELCRHIGREVAEGLAAIHAAGVVHRDVKPENVLITEDHVVKVMDLGVARLQDEAIRLSRAGAFVGSIEYAAPEQFRGGGRDADGRADLYALGLVLYELATGQHPFRDEDARRVLRKILDAEPRRPGEVNPQLSPFFEELVLTLLAKEADDRLSSATLLAAVLAQGEESAWWKERAQALRLETKAPLRRIRISRETAIYGRDDDLKKLHALYELANGGDGQVALVEGEAGIGKTRLVDEFVGRLRQDGEDVHFLFGSYPPGGAATASGAFSTAYREQFGEAGLEEGLRGYLERAPLLIPAFAALLRGDATPPGAEPFTKDSLQAAFAHVTTALAAEKPTIVLIDDLHFAPAEGRALFTSLALAAPGRRLLLIGTVRPGAAQDWVADLERNQATRVALSRLGPKDLARLLEDAFQSERLAKELGHQIAMKSDGNPFFAFEIIRGLREGQFITQSADGTWGSTQEILDIQVPSSV
ncbi:MAG: serine/threonine protein kinase, partial [Planctomycetota bacterium]